MTKPKKKAAKKNSPVGKPTPAPIETGVGESLAVFWVVTVFMCLMADLLAVFTHFYLMANPEAEKMLLLKGLVLFTGTLVGSVSLIVLSILYRVRQVPPPTGLAVFGACVAAAPVIAALAQAFQ